MIPTATAEKMSKPTEAAISYHGTALMAIRVNIAMGEVKGIKEQTFISVLSTVPDARDIIIAIKQATKSMVIGNTDVLISSNFDAVEPTAPYIKA